MNRDNFFAGLSGAALSSRLLTMQFLHDSRTDVIDYSAGWGHFSSIGGTTYRNGDTVAVPSGSSAELTMGLGFTSQGGEDEWVSLHGLTGCPWRIYVGSELVAERTASNDYVAYSPRVLVMEGGYLWDGGDLYGRPFVKLQPIRGFNAVRYVRTPSNDSTFLDGWGLNIRGTLRTL